MGRKERRANDKAVKKKLGAETVEQLKSLTFRKLVAEEATAQIDKFLKSFTVHLGNVMGENRISKERAEKIIREAIQRATQEDKSIEIE